MQEDHFDGIVRFAADSKEKASPWGQNANDRRSRQQDRATRPEKGAHPTLACVGGSHSPR